MSETNHSGNWEQQVLEKLVLSVLKEQRKSRNWSIFFKLLGLTYLFAILFFTMGFFDGNNVVKPNKHTALIELNGVIASDKEASADHIMKGLQEAFKDHGTKGIILRINSPGGSPVQAGNINREIKRLKAKYPTIPLYAVVEDVCASGGYYVAVAADKIYVDKASIVGSIGVVMQGFGFTGAMEKLGIERRLFTAGENKGFLDPFSPLNPKEKDYAEQMLQEIHQQFIQVVREGRGKRLKETPEMFSGLVWSGERSVTLGLTDALGSMEYVAREVIKAEDIVDFTPQENLAERFAKKLGAGVGSTFLGEKPKSSLF